MGKTVELCRPCAEKRRERGEKLTPVVQGIDKKIMCADCRHRRYGAEYKEVKK